MGPAFTALRGDAGVKRDGVTGGFAIFPSVDCDAVAPVRRVGVVLGEGRARFGVAPPRTINPSLLSSAATRGDSDSSDDSDGRAETLRRGVAGCALVSRTDLLLAVLPMLVSAAVDVLVPPPLAAPLFDDAVPDDLRRVAADCSAGSCAMRCAASVAFASADAAWSHRLLRVFTADRPPPTGEPVSTLDSSPNDVLSTLDAAAAASERPSSFTQAPTALWHSRSEDSQSNSALARSATPAHSHNNVTLTKSNAAARIHELCQTAHWMWTMWCCG